MNEQLRTLVQNRLSGAVNCPAKEDIVEEITADLTAKYDELLEAEYNPLINRALQSAYPPGSTYKMVTSIAALETGQITPQTEIYDKGKFDKYEKSGMVVRCLLYTNARASHGDLDVANALRVSCNYFYYVLGDEMKISELDKVAKAMGLGEPTGVELPESVGYRANPETKKKLYSGTDRVWVKGDMLTAVIGQSDNRFTPMQLAVYVATLANKGVRNKATFMNRVVSSDYQTLLAENTPKQVDKLNMKQSTIDAYFDGMYQVVNKRGGTAYKKTNWQNVPATVAGKTGTAQQFWGASDNGAFVCFAPYEDPEIAIAVYIEKGGHGSTLTTIARAVLQEYYDVGTVSEVSVSENKLS